MRGKVLGPVLQRALVQIGTYDDLGRGVDPDTDQAANAQLETQVPANAQHHNLRIEMAACKQLFDRNESGQSPIFAHPKSLHQP